MYVKRYEKYAGWFILSFALGLTACEPSNLLKDKPAQDPNARIAGEAQPAASPAPTLGDTPAIADTRPVLVCFGDSITAGYGVDPELNYPSDLQRLLDTQGYRYRVVNMGVSGETTKDGLARIAQVLSRKPELVVVEFGGNDGLRGLPIRDSQQNLTAIVSNLRRSGAKVVLAAISLPPQYGPDYIHQFEAVFPAVARQTNVPLIPFSTLAKGVYGVNGNIQDDQIHPTASGDKVLAANVAAVIRPLLRR